MSVREALSLWGPVAAVAGFIFVASSIPDPGPLPADLSDKVAHFAVYALLSATLVRALARARLDAVTWGRAAGAVLLSTLYGASDELHQMMVPGRSPDGGDIAADALGAFGGALAALVAARLLVRRGAAGRYTRSG